MPNTTFNIRHMPITTGPLGRCLKTASYSAARIESHMETEKGPQLPAKIRMAKAAKIPAANKTALRQRAVVRDTRLEGMGRCGRSTESCCTSHTSLSTMPPVYRQAEVT